MTRDSHRAAAARRKLMSSNIEVHAMLTWAIIFLIIAIVAAVLGFGGIAGTATTIAQVLFVVFLVLFIVSFFMSRRGRRP